MVLGYALFLLAEKGTPPDCSDGVFDYSGLSKMSIINFAPRRKPLIMSSSLSIAAIPYQADVQIGRTPCV